MRTFDFAPFYRSTVGYDRLFSTVDRCGRTSDPPEWRPTRRIARGKAVFRVDLYCVTRWLRGVSFLSDSYAGEILKILPRLSIDLRQRAKAANAAALVAMLLPDLSVRFWIYGLDDCRRALGLHFQPIPSKSLVG